MTIKTNEELNEIKRHSKSYEAIQQSAVIALMNSIGFTFEFRRPERAALKTIQYFYIQQLFYFDEKVDFEYSIDKFCEDQLAIELQAAHQSACKKTLKRRKDLNRAALTFNYLIKLLESLGYFVSTRPTKSSKKTLQMLKVVDIRLGNELLLNKESVDIIGKEINKYILSLFTKNERNLTLKKFDAKCNEVILFNNSFTKEKIINVSNTNLPIYYNDIKQPSEPINFNNVDLILENGFIQNID
ncbi:hypothetical protein EHI8A_014660 [Entamoeba histolytica HM-1:IMSS-B]|uniref:Uncharacterized protein n=5 Tax=Entamoeba histolytica TaxID=5759 RepID=C4M494_ENTH1|nr:hypothetical protein EHI_097960 [Entamoeba histolytica HM-1:IMSS]EMD48786.1 Hypothetical protein EHI5A_029120 [Entamoeba histolytica KU27]EMH77012.1 hypothetical protein EHI8A_014660 [Entamoeba histolytica HM-1:IMSS-B]ENY62944.1 hypothetical protein EHI7A_013450 [Entamoeba histolytica HM-1:IMSS-A]GAT96178.1 hypothetical protein CL6EHI_097960 [Entamoeba histolytica]EAL45668.1 hypothetical protein EHI_097960 [Entamoeba histolytica HM-1:IMSS]|eukprot:XP_651054.1 hypothetical protein EHI_097960 [Entamoeba histolytica HM-1:IMSS]